MGNNNKISIPENNSFEPNDVKKDIAELERLDAMGKLSYDGYGELAMLKIVAKEQEENPKK